MKTKKRITIIESKSIEPSSIYDSNYSLSKDVIAIRRQLEMLKLLVERDDYITLDELSKEFGVSTRTIRNDLDEIEERLKSTNVHLKRSRKLGIVIKKNDLNENDMAHLVETIKEESNYYPGNVRENIILQFILLNDKNFTIGSLAEKTMSSRNTTVRDLAKCEKWLNDRNITIERKTRSGMVLKYRELDWRKAVQDYMGNYLRDFNFQKLYNSFIDNEFLIFNLYVNEFINYFTKSFNLLPIKNFIRKYETDFKIKFTDEAFVNIFFYVCISAKRIQSGCELKETETVENSRIIDSTGIHWMKGNMEILVKGLKIDIGKDECNEILYNLLSQSKYYEKDYDIKSIPEETIIVEKFIDLVQKFLCIDLQDDETLFNNLLMHIRPAIHRILFKINIENPMSREIKLLYPEVFKACHLAGEVFMNEYGTMPDEDEISYLTMHIAASIERIKQNKGIKNFFKAVVVCSSGIGTSNLLYIRLLNEFPNLIIAGIHSVNEIGTVNKGGIDLIISTVPLSVEVKEPVIYVSPLLNSKDVLKIENFMRRRSICIKDGSKSLVDDLMSIISQECSIENYSRLNKRLSEYFSNSTNVMHNSMPMLSELLSKDCIRLKVEADNWKEAIQHSGMLLYNNQTISKGYITKLIESKNNLGPNIVIAPGIAMPHAKSEGEVIKTSMSVVTLSSPIEFGNAEYDPVWLIIALAAEENNNHLNVLSELVELIDDPDTLEILRSCTSEKDFIEAIADFEKSKQLRKSN